MNVFVVVLSARGKATDELEQLLETAAEGKDYKEELDAFITYQNSEFDIDISNEIQHIEKLLKGIALTGDYSAKTKDELLSHGELISARVVTSSLFKSGLKARLIDSRELLKTDNSYTNAEVDEATSKENVIRYFHDFPWEEIPVFTGFYCFG